LLTGKVVALFLAVETIVKWSIYSCLILWLLYVIGTALANDLCGCVKDYNNWWTAEYWTKKEGA